MFGTEGRITLTNEEFRLFRQLIYEESGIFLKESRKDFLEHRLEKRMLATDTKSPYWYYKLISGNGGGELISLLDLLTVNETSFFRNHRQMEFFEKTILSGIVSGKKLNGRRELRIWSAGCSTGEEPYSIAMIAMDTIFDYRDWDIRIFASDLSLSALDAAKKGIYDADKVHATVEDHYLTRYFEKEGERLRVKDSVKDMVVFDFHNMKHDNGLNGLDVIFCRNVMIYFDIEEQKRLLEKFYRSLQPNGYLFIGHAESLQGMGVGFEFIYGNGSTVYRKIPGYEKL